MAVFATAVPRSVVVYVPVLDVAPSALRLTAIVTVADAVLSILTANNPPACSDVDTPY